MEHFALARDADFHVPTAISFTMRALVYKPTDVWDTDAAAYGFFEPCQEFGPAISSLPPALICEAMIADWNRAFGIAVYDVEYDAEDLPCERFNHTGGSFSRLEAIKGMLHYAEKTRDDGLLRRYSSADKFCAQAALGSYYVPESTNGRAGDGGEIF
ncbi:hypothetical protein HPB48_009998 [Haemaphysalis longicornis]|uniref:Uncharacterized protein n=1 Tax=Haemaphysalis longicornis TaxID=44386 RepID=A0A9J6FXT2_HAELO|nr:hypothetical protein HPB48_009998 [Haemaphysalis longicornis]